MGQHPVIQRQRHLHLLEPGRLPGRTRAHLHAPGGQSRGVVHPIPGRMVRAGRLPPHAQPAGQPGPAPGAADARERQMEPGAARRLYVDGGQDQRARGLGRVLRLVRERHLRADDPRQRRDAVRRGGAEPGVSAHGDVDRHPAAGQQDPDGRLARPAYRAAGLLGLRPESHDVGGHSRRLHVDARLQHAAVGERERADRRRGPRPAPGQRDRAAFHR